MSDTPHPIKAVLFDFDGTLTQPGALDFSIIKRELGCSPGQPVLEYILAMPDPSERNTAMAALDRFDTDGAVDSKPNAGAEELIRYLKSLDIPLGVLTRNSMGAISKALENFADIDENDFDLIITRDTPLAPKPAPDGVLHAAEALGVAVEQMAFVGDYVFDIEAGNRAGAVTVLLAGNPGGTTWDEKSDFEIARLSDLKAVISLNRPLGAGKFPNELLKLYLDEFAFEDPSVIINLGIGEDIAAVDVAPEEVLVLKSDPITFSTDAIGRYAVLVNANDIATSGADPRWLLTTLLFPCGVTPNEVFRVLRDLKSVCEQWGITLCGGHTEITDAVSRPVISGMMAGTLSRNGLIEKHNMRPGDRVLLTKGVAVEGTSIIAREFHGKLLNLGMTEADIRQCKNFLDDVSILPEARVAREFDGVCAMHDVTEGGVATALEELSIAGGHRIRVDMDAIPVFPQTRQICELLGIDPLGLIGSGSLLICCREGQCRELMQRIGQAGIAVSCVGEVVRGGQGIEAVNQGRAAEWPKFDVDEITRLF